MYVCMYEKQMYDISGNKFCEMYYQVSLMIGKEAVSSVL